jgi:hypothetical protein
MKSSREKFQDFSRFEGLSGNQRFRAFKFRRKMQLVKRDRTADKQKDVFLQTNPYIGNDLYYFSQYTFMI